MMIEETNKYILIHLDSMKNITIRTNVEFSKQSYKLASFVEEKRRAASKKDQGLAAAGDRVYTGEVSGELTEVEVLDIKDSSHLITERLYRAIEPITFESRAKHMVHEYTEIPEYEIINLLIMHKNIEGEYNIGNTDSDDSNYFIVPSDSSIVCFYYDYNHYCIDKELIRYTYDEGELIAKIYYEDLGINGVTTPCQVTVISIDN